MIPETAHLLRIKWQLFGTLTFKRAEMPEGQRKDMVFALLHEIVRPLRVQWHNLLWVLRLEEGEITQRKHFHLLIGGLPEQFVTTKRCFIIMNTWEGLGGGMARVRIYDPRLAGVDYVTKCLGWEAGRTLEGANRYEVEKFDSEKVLQLTPSKSVMWQLRKYVEGSNTYRGRDKSRLR